MQRVYISGRISGLPYSEAFDKFQKIETTLRRKGYDVVNPLKNGLDISEPWETHIALDIINLLGCDSVYMMPDFSESRGALLEYNIAKLTGKTIIYGEKPRFLDIKQAIYVVFGITFEEIISQSKERPLVYARMIFSRLCIEEGLKLVKVGEILHRNHSTIVYYLKNYNIDIVYNEDFKTKCQAVRDYLNAKKQITVKTQTI